MTLSPDRSPGGGRLAPGVGPLLFLDVDGPLNKGWWTSPERFPGLRDAGWHAERVTGCPLHEDFRVVLNPAWGQLLLGLADLGATLAWATGWGACANDHIGPLLGLPELPVAPAVYGAKASTVIPWGQGRPWAWLEDDAEELEAATALSPPGVPCLPVLVDKATGLTPKHVARVASWLTRLQPAPHAPALRRRPGLGRDPDGHAHPGWTEPAPARNTKAAP